MTKRQMTQIFDLLEGIRQDQKLLLEKQTAMMEDLAEIKARQQWMEEEMMAETRVPEGLGMRQVFLN